MIDAGTAITLDLLTADGAHLGGYILPGADLMSRALTNATGRINVALQTRPHWRRVTAQRSVSVLVRGGRTGGSAVGIGRLSGSPPAADRRGRDALIELGLAAETCPDLVFEGLRLWLSRKLDGEAL